MEFKNLSDYTDNELKEIINGNLTYEMSKLGAISSEILRRYFDKIQKIEELEKKIGFLENSFRLLASALSLISHSEPDCDQ